MAITRLTRFRLVTGDTERLARFYETALGASLICGGVAIGEQIIEFRQPAPPGRPYPADQDAASLLFQHFAIVTLDMTAAWQRLQASRGWTPISTDGPVRLPATSGGVTAVKFRDPEGHPLELLEFPHGTAARSGIDHSAISVADTARSVDFYEGLGFRVSGRSINCGPEQERLDGIAVTRVEVTALAPPAGTPHLELLCYRDRPHKAVPSGDDDIAATVLVFEAEGPARQLRDPDGHRLALVPAAH